MLAIYGYKDLCTYPTEEQLQAGSDEPVAVDTETVGHTRQSNIVHYFSWAARDLGAGAGPLLTADGMSFFKRLMASPRPKIFHNGKFDVGVIEQVGFKIEGQYHDTMLMHALLDEHHLEHHRLKSLSRELLGRDREDQHVLEEAKENYHVGLENADVPQEVMHPYAVADAQDTLDLFYLFKPQLEELKLWDLYINEVATSMVYKQLDRGGIGFDSARAKQAIADFAPDIKEIEETIYAMSGHPFLISSGKQLGEVLHRLIGLRSKTKSLQYKTDKETLGQFSHEPIVQWILAHKSVTKARNSLMKHLEREAYEGSANRLYTNYRQDTVTGRSACSETPLQQIPKGRGKLSSKDKDDRLAVLSATAFKQTRAVFIPAAGSVLVSIDYDQGEYRAAAHYSGSDRLIQIFLSGEDFHESTCKLVFGEYRDDLRIAIKVINFGLLYGMSEELLVKRIQRSNPQPWSVLQKYEQNLPEMRQFQQAVINVGKQYGYVKDMFGRYYHVPPRERWKDKRPSATPPWYMLIAYLCQGTIANVKKFAMVRVARLLQGRRSQIVADIHDELVIEMYPEDAELLPDIQATMQDFPQFKVPFTCGPAVGMNLLECKEKSMDEMIEYIKRSGGVHT